MQNREIQEFASKTSLMLPDVTNRRLVLPAIIGFAVGSFLKVNQGPELNPITAFNDLHIANVSRAVSFLNEEFVFDTKSAIEAARSMFLLRHRIVNAIPMEGIANPEFDFVSCAAGVSSLMPVETYEAIKATGLGASRVLQRANLLVASLKAQGKLAL